MTSPVATSVSPTSWLAKNRTILLISLGFLAVVLLAGILGANAPAPAWAATGGQIGHPLAIIVDAVDGKTLYAGTEAGAVATSSDAGATWSDLSKGLPAKSAVSALLQSSDGQRLLAGTSAGVASFDSLTKTWTTSTNGLPADDGIDALAFGSADAMSVLAGSEMHGVFRSTDGGKTWTASANGLPAQADIYSLTASPDFKHLYAGLIGAGIYLSSDDGQTWTAANTGLPAPVNVFTIAQSTTTSGKATLMHLIAGTSQGIFRSDDGGAHWAASSKGVGTIRALSLSVDAQQPQYLLAGTDAGTFISVDGGFNWSVLTKGIPGGQHIGAVAISHPHKGAITLFAAGDQIYHYPGQTGSFLAIASRVLIFAALIGALIWVGTRQRRILQSMTPVVSKSAATLKQESRAPRPVIRSTNTSHIRGGPPPRPPQADDEEGN